MNRKLYVNNIPWSATSDDLRNWIRDMGFVVDEVKIIMSAEDGRSRGFGFVTFRIEADASRALVELEGANCLGRTLHVAEAIAKRSGDRQTSESSRSGGSRSNGSADRGRDHRAVSFDELRRDKSGRRGHWDDERGRGD